MITFGLNGSLFRVTGYEFTHSHMPSHDLLVKFGFHFVPTKRSCSGFLPKASTCGQFSVPRLVIIHLRS